MAADNLAGAPTQGLGQTVTFAFDPGKAVQQQNLDIGSGNGGVNQQGRAGQFNVGQAAAPAPDLMPETLDVLGRLAGNVMKPAVERAKLEKFSQGMQQAAAGKAIQEVAAEQPWYATMFGEADAVQGARTYHAVNKVYQAQDEIESQWDILKTMSPEAQRGHINSIVASKMTGDPYADAEIMQQTGRVLPGVFKKAAKEHIKYVNEEASKQELTTFMNAGRAYQRDMGSDTRDELGSFTSLREAFVPANGRRDAGWAENVTTALTTLANEGHLLASDAMLDLQSELPPTMQYRISQARRAASNLKQAEVWAKDPEMARTVAGLRGNIGNPGVTAEEMVTQMNAANAVYTTRYGGEPIFSAADFEAAASGQVRAVWQAQKAEAGRAGSSSKETDAEEMERYDAAVFQPGVYHRVDTGELKEAGVKQAMYRQWANPNLSLGAKYNLLVIAGRVTSTIKDNIQEVASRALLSKPGEPPVYTGAAQAEFVKWQTLHTMDQATALNYYGPELNSKFSKMLELTKVSGFNPEHAFVSAMNHKPTISKSDEGAKAGVKYATNQLTSYFKIDGAVPPASEEIMAEIGQVGASLHGGPPEYGAKLEWDARVKSGAIEVSGMNVWKSSPENNFMPVLRNMHGVVAGDEHIIFEQAIKEIKADVGATEDPKIFMYSKTAAGEPQLLMLVMPENGFAVSRVVTPKHIIELADRKRQAGLKLKAAEEALKQQRSEFTDPTWAGQPARDNQSPEERLKRLHQRTHKQGK